MDDITFITLASSMSKAAGMARLLLKLRDGDSNGVCHFSLKDIRAMLCITVETVSRVITEFASLGLLVRTGKHNEQFFTADIAALERVAAGGIFS